MRRRKARSRIGFAHAHLFHLLIGRDYFRDAFRDDEAAMRTAWPALREDVFALLAERHRQGRSKDRLRPWAWWAFESREPRDASLTEAEQLARMGVRG